MFVVRHAKAGDRQGWAGDDSLRPLTKPGRRQAEGLHAALGPHGVAGAAAVLSSDYVRCVQTVEPLAAELGREVGEEAALREGTPVSDVLDLLRRCGAAVLCTHGDVMAELVESLDRAGVAMRGGTRWEKACTWVLDCDDRGDVVAGLYVAPPP